MTNDSKIALAITGFFICVILGWALPLLWLLFIIGCIALVAVPSKKKSRPQPQGSQEAVVDTGMNSRSTELKIEAMIRDETDEKVREGLRRALSIVQGSSQSLGTFVDDSEPQAEVSQAERNEQKKRQELRNINTILYTASFLLVGAAALFIGFNDQASPTLKFMTLLLAASLFYGTGLVLHERSARLLPAATAFIGTGLALIPFVGLALNSYIIQNPSASWFLTSLVGLVAFMFAVYKTRSTVMAYLALGFVFSLASSTMSVLDTPFVWYFIGIIVTSSLLTYVAYKRPGSVPEYFKKPLELNAQLAVPVVILGSLLMTSTFTAFEYAMISGVGALHYLVMTLACSVKQRFTQWTAARALLIIFAATLAYHFTQSMAWVSVVLLASGVLVHLYSTYRFKHDSREAAWLWVAQGLVATSIGGWYDNSSAISATLALVIGISLWQLYVTRRVEYVVAAVISAVILPLTVLRGVVDPMVGYEIIALITLAAGTAFLFGRWFLSPRHASFKQAASLFYVSFLAEAIILAAMSSQWVIFGVVMVGAGILLHVASFIEREETLVIGSNVMLLVGVFALYGQLLDSYTWVPIATGLTLGAIWYGLSWYHRRTAVFTPSDRIRSILLAISAIVVLGLAAFIAMFQTDQTIVAGAIVGCLTAGVVAYEGYVRKRFIGLELAVYIATFCVQRVFAHMYPDADWLIYTHWWALTGGAVAWLHYRRTGNRDRALVRAILSLSLLSIPTGLAALADPTSAYRTIFLLEHVVLAMAGLALSKKIAVVWGAVGIGLAVLYMLQGYTYLLLTVVALSLIVLAVWRLSKKG